MQENSKSFTKEELITEVISKNIPSAWVKDFRMFKLHLKMRIRDALTDLMVIEEQVKTNLKPTNSDKKQHLKNLCRVHNGGNEWDDCRQNPKNLKPDEKNKAYGRTEQNGGRTREHRHTKHNNSNHQSTQSNARSRSNSRSRARNSSDSEYEYNGITKQKNKERSENTPSSEILMALPNANNSKKYTTYLGLVDSGSSGSFISKDIADNGNFNVQVQKKPT